MSPFSYYLYSMLLYRISRGEAIKMLPLFVLYSARDRSRTVWFIFIFLLPATDYVIKIYGKILDENKTICRYDLSDYGKYDLVYYNV